MQSGEVEKRIFKEQIPFEFDGFVKIKIKIHGKEYTFVFDTGAAISVISNEVAKELNLAPYTTAKVIDSRGEKRVQNLFKIDTVKVGKLAFSNLAFVEADFSKIQCFGQIPFDGILGTNLMKQAVWYINNAKDSITIYNSRENSPIMKDATTIPFKTKFLNNNPFFPITIEGLVDAQEIELDIGSYGYISLNSKQINKNYKGKTFTNLGNSSAGLFGSGNTDSSYFAKVNKMMLGSLQINAEQIISFDSNTKSILGMKFLRNFNILLDWNKKEFVLSKIKDLENVDTIKGFKIGLVENNFIVNEIMLESDAQKKGLLLGDKILRINNTSYQNLNEANKCKLLSDFNNSRESTFKLLIERDKKILELEIDGFKL